MSPTAASGEPNIGAPRVGASGLGTIHAMAINDGRGGAKAPNQATRLLEMSATYSSSRRRRHAIATPAAASTTPLGEGMAESAVACDSATK